MHFRYLLVVHETYFEVFRLVTERVGTEAIGKGEKSVREVVLSEPGDYASLLHIRPTRDVDDQIAKLLPMTNYIDGARLHFGVSACHGHGRSERSVDAEDDSLRLESHTTHVHTQLELLRHTQEGIETKKLAQIYSGRKDGDV